MDFALQILHQYWGVELLPVDIYSIVRSVGVNILNFKYNKHEFGRVAICNNQPFFNINPDALLVHQRFTLAHLLGHYLLRHCDNFESGDSFVEDESTVVYLTNQDYKEKEATYFAINILMPNYLVDFYIESEDNPTVESLANEFMVSDIVMKSQLKFLKWIS